MTKKAILSEISAKVTAYAREVLENSLVKLYEDNIDEFNSGEDVFTTADEINAIFYTADFLDFDDEEWKARFYENGEYNGDNFSEILGGVIFGKIDGEYILYYDSLSSNPPIYTIEEFTENNADILNLLNVEAFRKVYTEILTAVKNR